MCDQVTHYVTKLRRTCSKLAETLFKVIKKKTCTTSLYHDIALFSFTTLSLINIFLCTVFVLKHVLLAGNVPEESRHIVW